MKIYLILALSILTTFQSCDSRTEKKTSTSNKDSLELTTEKVYYDRTENLKLSIADTIKKSAYYFFSNSQTKDLFLLTIEPGMVKNSKSLLQIITGDNKLIYSQSFDTYYFVKWIYDPQTIPKNIGQNEYEDYLDNYAKSITPKQYETYFKKEVDSFFEAFNFLDKTKFEELKEFGGDINDNDFLNEYYKDTTIQLIDIPCFDCDEGASIIGFSKNQNKLVELFDHD
ncbi:MAG: hypothetical protein LW669_04980 [Sphingobacteriales bacterium]|nr:hypothetical protein [Sphingobacteriales bacterium]